MSAINRSCPYCVRQAVLTFTKTCPHKQKTINQFDALAAFRDDVMDCLYDCERDPHCPDCFGCITSGTSYVDDEGSYYAWALYSKKLVEKFFGDLSEETLRDFVCREGFYYQAGYPGHRFYSEPSVRVSRNYVLIKQYSALDI